MTAELRYGKNVKVLIYFLYMFALQTFLLLFFNGKNMTKQDEIAAKAVRNSTLKSLNLKRKLRIKQIKEETEAKIREINIQYAEDPERLRAKYAADDYARSERAKKRAAQRIEKEKKHLAREHKLRAYSLGEEIFSSVVQGIGACLFIAATVLLDVVAIDSVPEAYKTPYLTVYTCFGVTMILSYIMSILHHALTNSSAKEVFKRLCHIGVFLIIACAYSAYSLVSVTNVFGWVVTGIVWVTCFVGIMMYAIAGTRLELVNIIFYAVLGWAGLFICNQVYHAVTPASFRMLIISGIVFTAGLVFCSLRKVKFMHAIGDLILLIASIFLFFSFFFIF